MKRQLMTAMAIALGSVTAMGAPFEITCTIIKDGRNLACQVLGKDRKVMSPEDITNFVDAGEVAAYMNIKSKKGMERTFFIDSRSPQYKKLSDVKRSGSISDIAKAKTDLFGDIEQRAIKLSDQLDNQASQAELLLYDSSITADKLASEMRSMSTELRTYRDNKDRACTETPAYENLTRANARLRQTLSNIVYAFQAPDTCMSNFKVFKDKDGAVDLRQLGTAADYFKASCKMTAKK